MHRARTKLVLAGIALTLLAGCARREKPVAPAPAPTRPAPEASSRVPRRAALPSASYVATAASIELYEIRSAELALQRARTRSVRDFAAMALDAHKGASMQLSLAGRRLNLLPSATLGPAHQAMIDELRSAADFDALYRRQQVATHRDALTIHGNYAALGTSPTLRPVAASLVRLFQRHSRLLGSL